MKRTPLNRKTPLRAKKRLGATTRAPRHGKGRAWHRAPDDRVDGRTAALVFAREHHTCVLRILARKRLIDEHTCRDAFGAELRPNEALTIEHVKLYAKVGERAPSEPMFLAAACADANVNGATSRYRRQINEYLDGIYGRDAREQRYRELTGSP
jgi:hypothetical protein